jgi:hypothetical protein
VTVANGSRMDWKRTPSRRMSALIAAVAVLCLVALLVGVLILGNGNEGFEPELGVPTAASVSQLRELSSESKPVYWAGPPHSGRLEVWRTEGDAIYVRYLPPGVEIGDPTARFTTVGTYAARGAYTSLLHDLQTAGTLALKPRGGGVGVWQRARPTSVRLAYPNVDAVVEVYDPSPRRARNLARSGKIRRVP